LLQGIYGGIFTAAISYGSVSNANPSGGIPASDNAVFGLQPQGHGWRIDWQIGLRAADLANNTGKPFQYGGIVAGPPDCRGIQSRNRGHRAVLCHGRHCGGHIAS
jgi:hypothetical protein